jgi:aminoglycoside phosphotransferase (APT) family kinase protein
MANRPEAEIDITQDLVQALLDDQFPELASLTLSELSRGWDNTNLLVGDAAIARVPHRQVAARLIDHEQAWLPVLATQIDLPISAPTHAGTATDFFPWPWSVTPFFPGTEAATAPLVDPAQTAATLARFFRQVHTPAPPNAPTNEYRGCPLVHRAQSFATNLSHLDASLDRQQIATIFEEACAVDPTNERVWLHGDLHTRNMIASDGDLVAVIDWGDICAGDRATDLAGAFMLVPDELAVVQQHAGADDDAWQRARGWAANFAVIYLAHCDDDPVMGGIGLRLLDTLLTT